MSDFPVSITTQDSVISSSGEQVPSFYESLLDSLFDGVYFVNSERKIQYWNKGAENLTGYPASEALGRHCFDNFLVHVNDEGCTLCLDGCPLTSTLSDGKLRVAEVFLRHKLGHRIPVFIRVAPINDASGKIIGAVEVFSDVSLKKNIERRVGELESLVFLDALTGVPNRRYTELKVRQAIQEFEQFGRKIGLLMLDVDHFKVVNDTYGHEVGDQALKALCNTLINNLRAGDIFGRWGGEEFLVIIYDAGPDELETFAERCRILTEETSIPLKGSKLQIQISVGATLLKSGDTDMSVINRADALMYKSKVAGRNRVTVG